MINFVGLGITTFIIKAFKNVKIHDIVGGSKGKHHLNFTALTNLIGLMAAPIGPHTPR